MTPETGTGPAAAAWTQRPWGRRVTSNLMRVVPVRLFARLLPRPAIGLCYHTVSREELPHVRQLYPYKSPEQFDADLAFLKANFRVVGYEELERGVGSSGNAVVLTFDDGLSECFTAVRPLLLKHGLPCIFFVSPPHLDNRRAFPMDRASLALDALERMPGSEREAALARIAALAGRPLPDLPSLAIWLTRWMRTLDPEQEGELDRICEIVGVDVDAHLRERRPCMTRDQVRTLAADGFTIGAHGLRHVALGAFPPETVRREILGSIAEVRDLCGAARVPFAFPYDADGVDRDLLAGLRAEDPSLGLLFNTGPLGPDREFMVNRMIVDAPGVLPGSNLGGYLREMYLREILPAGAPGPAARPIATRG